MSFASDEEARTAAVEFSRGIAAFWSNELGADVLGVYLVGSLAHGGFSRRYSDVDLALIVERAIDPSALGRMQAEALALSPDFAAKLSLFWADRHFSIGRFPPLDRIDFLDHRVPLTERDAVRPDRPSLEDVRAYLGGAPFAGWQASVRRFVSLDALMPEDRKQFLRALLYPARFAYSWVRGAMGSNDEAVDYLSERRLDRFDIDLMQRALQCRRAARDPDDLFPDRARLHRQVEACVRLVKR